MPPMAKHMAEREYKYDPIRSALNFVARVAREAGGSKADKARAAAEGTKKIFEKERGKQRSQQAQEWLRKIRSDKREDVLDAENIIHRESYTPKSFVESQQALKQTLEVAHARGEIPDWLIPDAAQLQHSSQAVELVARIAVLPKDLQNNPYILYGELRKMEASIDFLSKKTTHAEVLEAKFIRNVVIDRIEQRVHELINIDPTSQSAKDLIVDFQDIADAGAFAPQLDLYKGAKFDEQPDPGRKPDKDPKKRAEFEEWQRKRSVEKQRDNLHGDLEAMQTLIDNGFIDLDDELKQLTDMQRRLQNGTFQTFDGEVELDKTTYNVKDAKYHIDRIAVRRKVVQAELDEQRHLKKSQEQTEQAEIFKIRKKAERDERIADLRKQGAAFEWTKELAKRFPHVKADIEDIIYVREFSNENLNLVLSGDFEKLNEWFSKFWQGVYTFGSTQARADIAEMYEWKGFEKLLELLYPAEQQHFKHQFKEQWIEIGHIDGVVKSIFQYGDLKEKMKGMGFLKPYHMQYLFRNFQWSEYTYSLTKDVAMDRLGRRFADFDSKVAWLRGPLTDQELQVLQQKPEWPDVLRVLRARDAHGHAYEGPVTRDRLLKALQVQYAKRDGSGEIIGFGQLSPELYDMMMELQRARDRVGRGEYLRDFDILHNASLQQELSQMHIEYGQITNQLTEDTAASAKSKMAPNERNRLEERLKVLRVKMEEDWKLMTEIPGESRVVNDYDLTAVSGYSPVEIEVRERLLPFLRQKLIASGELPNAEAFKAWLPNNEWRIRNSILAARYASVGWGDILDIGARVARAPTLDLNSEVTAIAGRDVMPGPAVEPVARALNANWFRDRFGMGGKMGDEIYDYYYQLQFEKLSPDFWENMSPEVKRDIQLLRKEGKPVYKRIIAEAEQYFGIPYTEILRPGFMHTGTHFSNSYWRAEVGFLEPYREKMMALKGQQPGREQWILDNQALSLQFAALNPLDEGQIPMRIKLLEKMLGRTPSRFIQLLGKDLHAIIAREGFKANSPEWYKFQTALSNAQMHVWDDQEGLNVRQINLFDRSAGGDFDTVLRPHLDAVGITDRAEQDKLGRILDHIRIHATTPDRSEKSLLEKWATHSFPLTLPLIDFNVKNARPELLNAFSNERRVNDMNAMGEVMGLEFELFRSQNISPPDGNFTKHAELLKKYRDTFNSYDSTDTAERAAGAIADTTMYFNMDRSMYNVVGWLPFSKRIMRAVSESDLSFIKKTKNNTFLNRMTDGNWKYLAEHDIQHWPHSVAQAISIAVKYLGGEGTSLNANELGSYVSTLEDFGIFSELRDLPKQLRSKYKSGFMYRWFYHLPRRYWWVVPVATIGIAVSQGVDDEKKSAGSSH